VPERRADTLLSMSYFIKTATLDRAWLDLTDDEFFWEPAPGSWSVRQRADCATPHPFGEGQWVVDFDRDIAATADRKMVVEPLTTIAWLMWHVGSQSRRLAEFDFLGGRTLLPLDGPRLTSLRIRYSQALGRP
jgi:hypothetical protein